MKIENPVEVKTHITANDSRHCPSCNYKGFSLDPNIWNIPPFLGGNEVLPIVILTCQRCGYVMPYGATQAGARKIKESL